MAPLTRDDVSRLLGRFAFGATRADLDRWTGRSQGELAEFLLDIPAPAVVNAQPDEPERQSLATAGTAASRQDGRNQLAAAQGWWLERMRNTPWPLLERLTLFWHDHFATAMGEPNPDVAMLMVQNETFRRGALGNFSDLVGQMTVDAAMLYWLDGTRNVRGKPNENYARELLELFTMGVSPQQFGEDDIREAARALTGWVVDGSRRVVFDARRHDTGPKQVLGRRITDLGATEHLAVRDAALATPVATRFLAFKLVQKLAYDPGPIDLMADSEPVVARVAAALRPGWDLRRAVKALLESPELLDPARRSVRQPVEQAVHACKVLNVAADATNVLRALDGLGQSLFDPPNVGGWPVGEEWISPGTTLARYALANHIEAEARRNAGPADLPVGPATLPASGDLAGWTARFGLAALTPNTRNALQSYLEAAKAAKSPENQMQRGVMTLLISSPEWTVM